ncbi:MAG: GNAT family N-acetyltransferase [Crocinitomicaceae bacterium]|nr:GNAT family N-acetyltransferase [Crocinitomicaceae bacterium]|tara:strand:+ start:6881 stop:7324 length:444 start_codon:yes stop_codon:yes gene_type:complete
MTFEIKHWDELSKDELYDIIQLRIEVFVIEQDCPYQECDGTDRVAFHLLIQQNEELIGTARIIPKEGDRVALGRIVIKKKNRMEGIGKRLMKSCLEYTREVLHAKRVTMSAQTYLIKFYSEFGFETRGEEYLEDDLPHIAMELTLGS